MTKRELSEKIANLFTWFDYQDDEQEKFIQELCNTCDVANLEHAWKWYSEQHFDYMAKGEYAHATLKIARGI